MGQYGPFVPGIGRGKPKAQARRRRAGLDRTCVIDGHGALVGSCLDHSHKLSFRGHSSRAKHSPWGVGPAAPRVKLVLPVAAWSCRFGAGRAISGGPPVFHMLLGCLPKLYQIAIVIRGRMWLVLSDGANRRFYCATGDPGSKNHVTVNLCFHILTFGVGGSGSDPVIWDSFGLWFLPYGSAPMLVAVA